MAQKYRSNKRSNVRLSESALSAVFGVQPKAWTGQKIPKLLRTDSGIPSGSVLSVQPARLCISMNHVCIEALLELLEVRLFPSAVELIFGMAENLLGCAVVDEVSLS